MSGLPHRRAGFTLIELLVALTLAAGLMVATLGLTGGLARSVGDRPTAGGVSAPPRSLERLADRLVRDLEQADAWRVGDEGGVDDLVFWARGPLARTSGRGPAHDPAEVTYRMVRSQAADGRGPDRNGLTLIRQQNRLLDRTSRPVETEVLGLDIRSLTVEPVETDGVDRSRRVFRLVLEAEAGRVERVLRGEAEP